MKKTKAIADHYGKEHQTIKAMEELAELIQALAKGDIENIKEEIADVRVKIEMCQQCTEADRCYAERCSSRLNIYTAFQTMQSH